MKMNSSYLPTYEDGTECSETSAYKIQTPGNCPEESIQHSEHGDSLKSNRFFLLTPPMKLEQCVPKRQHIKFRRRATTEKKDYNLHNTVEV